MKNIKFQGNKDFLNSLSPARPVFHNGDGGDNAENSEMEFVEAETIRPVDKRKEMEGKLSDAVARLENKMKEMKADPKYKDIVSVAEARLETAKKDMKKRTDAQVNSILSDIRLSIITANREQMTARLVEVEETLRREREKRLAEFKKTRDEMAEKYKGWPATTDAIDQSYSIRSRAVETQYLQKRVEAQKLFMKAFRELGPSVEDVSGTFMLLGLDYDDMMVRTIPDLNKEADNVINLEQYKTAADVLYDSERGKIVNVLHDDRIAALTLALNAVDAARKAGNAQLPPDEPEVTAEALADKIKQEQDTLEQGNFSAVETAKRVAALHETFSKEFASINNPAEPGPEQKGPERVAAADADKNKRVKKAKEA